MLAFIGHIVKMHYISIKASIFIAICINVASEQNQRIVTKVCEQESLTKIVNVVVQEQGSGVRTGPFSIDHIEKIHKLCT